MTAQTLPDDPNYCFVPAYDIEDEVQQIRIVVDDMTGYIPTALVALTIIDAERLCDRLNAKLGLSREDWTKLSARSMRAETPDSSSTVGNQNLLAGWPRAVTHPRLPRFRACPIRAPGSSDDGLAAQRYTLCTTRAAGRG